MFADVLIQDPYARRQERLTYSVPDHMSLKPGQGVEVPFRKGKKPALVLNLHENPPNFETRAILETVATEFSLESWQIALAEWMKEYYWASFYDVIKLMVPKGLMKKARKSTDTEKSVHVKKAAQKEKILSTEQSEILESFLKDKPKVSLIFGVTGSGKTELYKKIIQESLARGKQALLLVPEISLTPQMIRYFEADFPDCRVIHSRIGDREKKEAWLKIQKGEIPLVIGSRSALFSPFKNLGLILMDEEHEWSYKQEQSPRYHARTVALKMGELTGAQLIFGSATPSFETYNSAKKGDYAFYTMKSRVQGTPLPNVEIVDMRKEIRAGNYSFLSASLEQKISSNLAKGEQCLLFLNRRGSASATVCRDCGNAISCHRCDVKLTFHKSIYKGGTLICHHCGWVQALPEKCPKCESTRIRHFGLGTEQVETKLKEFFPNARIARADRDTMNQKNSFETLHKNLHEDQIDILIGTQMIGKGWDLPRLTLVGVLMADIGLHIPDFRSGERSFQLLTQVAGRAGRRDQQGEVLIQSYSPEHPALQFSKNHDYVGFYEQEISSRQIMKWPPFGQIIKMTFVSPKLELCKSASENLKIKLLEVAPAKSSEHQIFSAPALLTRIHNKYHWHVFIQGPDPRSILKKLNPEEIKDWRIDVDPVQCV